jgi:DNA-binding FadR family transcriptional regulator
VAGDVKGAERLAQRVVDDIAAEGWPVGTILGTEPALVARYGVSRNTFREAVRLLEHLGVARMREGRSGGLAVTEPRPDAVTHAAAIYLRYAGVGVGELYQARSTLEAEIVGLAAARLDADGERRLHEAIAHERETDASGPHHTRALHMTLADIAGNRPLALFLDTLISLSDEYSRPEISKRDPALDDAVEASHRAHAAIANAVLARDVPTAQRRMRAHLAAVDRWMPKAAMPLEDR